MEIDAPREDKDDPAAPTPSKAVNTGRFGAGSDVAALKAWEKKLAELVPSVAVTDETELGDGYLVWARLDGHPWWPSTSFPFLLLASPLRSFTDHPHPLDSQARSSTRKRTTCR